MTQDWKKELSNTFYRMTLSQSLDVQFFIENLLEEQRLAILEEVEKLNVVLDDNDGQSNIEKMLFKDDILKIINNLK